MAIVMVNLKIVNTGDNFEYHVDVTMKRQIMKRTEDKERIMRNPLSILKKCIFADIHH